MDDHLNTRILLEMADRMRAGDVESALPVLADDVEGQEIGRAEPKRGSRHWRSATPSRSATFENRAEVHDVLGNDGHAIQLINGTASRGGKTLNYRTAEIYHRTGGEIMARWTFPDDTARIVEFFG